MQRGAITLALVALVAPGGACLNRVDVASVLRALPDDVAARRYAQVEATPTCQQALQRDDAECWLTEHDQDVVVETGISRSLHGYLTSPYTVQTHLKVRLLPRGSGTTEVYYFADGGAGGLDEREGFGLADGRINVLCTTDTRDLFDARLDSNHRTHQAQVDAVVRCVHREVAAGPHFGAGVRTCLEPLREAEARVARVREEDAPGHPTRAGTMAHR